MIKYLYILPVVSVLSLGAFTFSNAQDFLAPIQAKIDSVRQSQDLSKEKALEQKQQMESGFSSSTNNNTDGQNSSSTQGIRNYIESKIGKPLDDQRMEIAEGFENALKNLKDLMERISSRIAKMQAAGIDISSSAALFDTAEANIEIASNNLNDLESALAKPTSISTRKAILARIKTESDKTKSSLETAYKSIMALIDSLKQESSQAQPASSSNSTSSVENQDQSTTSSDSSGN